MNETELKQYDHYLASDGPAALVIREQLAPVEGVDAVFFPSTYAASEDKSFPGGYNINTFPDGSNIVLVDSIGSQANRIEPLFKSGDYAKLVPQIVITAGEKKVNLLDAGHRAGDAIVRCSSLKTELETAFKELLKGDAMSLAKLAPTSLVFGVWDSRDTQAKAPRLIASTIRAYNVKKLTRSAQYWAGGSSDPVSVYDSESVLGPIKDDSDRKERSTSGLTHVPATNTHGGVIAEGGIRRDASLALSALRLLASTNPQETLKLHRYILGLALVAFTKLPGGYLRQGTILVNNGKPIFQEVASDGTRRDSNITHEAALKYAKQTAEAFGVGEPKEISFDSDIAKAELAGKAAKKAAKKAKKEKAVTASDAAETSSDTLINIDLPWNSTVTASDAGIQQPATETTPST